MLPSVVLSDVTIKGSYVAQLFATIDPSLLSTSYYFEYSTDNLFSSSIVTPTLVIAPDGGISEVAKFITGLIANTQYFFRLIATNGSGSVSTVTKNFTTYPIPSLTPQLEDENQRESSISGFKGIFRDFNQFDPNQPFLYNVAVIAQSVNNFFRTPKKTRFFDNAYGSNFDKLPFELDDFVFEDLATTYILEVHEFEPRCVIDLASTFIIPFFDDYEVNITIGFSVNGEQTDQVFSLDLPNLNRG